MSSGSVNVATAANRVNIPAIGRIPGRGTVTLISPGLLLTSTRVVGNKQEAARLKAIFFESNSKQRKDIAEVKLLPDDFFFASVYPEHLDYCIVACDTSKIFNVTPVKIPLVRSEWRQVREGDHLLVVQHPLPLTGAPASAQAGSTSPSGADKAGSAPTSPQSADSTIDATSGMPIEVKPILDVLRRRDDLYYLKPNPTYLCAGCPCFNDSAELVGLHSQFIDGEEGMVSRVLSIATIVKHAFATGQLSRIQQKPLFEDIWETWYVTGEPARIVAILANFKQKEVSRAAVEKLCEHTSHGELIESVVVSGGTKVIIENINRFRDDEELVALGLRSLWNISFSQENNRQDIVNAKGIDTIHNALKTYLQNEQVAQFATVLLFNLTLNKELIGDWCYETSRVVLSAMKHFEHVDVIQKFGIDFFVNMAKKDIAFARDLVQMGSVEHTTVVMKRTEKNEYLAENAVMFMAALSVHPTLQGHPSFQPVVPLIIDMIMRFKSNNSICLQGNHALWGLGNDPINRIEILNHPQGPTALSHSIRSVSSYRGL